jgi:hypothetical protein
MLKIALFAIIKCARFHVVKSEIINFFSVILCWYDYKREKFR